MKQNRVTIKDIAREAGVSTALVSFALSGKNYRVSEETVARIKATADRLGYYPNSAAKSLRSGRTYTIGVILTDISNRFFADIARCIEDRASQSAYTVIFGSTDDDPAKLEQLIKVFVNKGVDGLIIVPCDGAEATISKLVSTGMPVVLIDRTYEDLAVSSVTLANRRAMSLAVKELVEHGASHVSLVSYETSTSNITNREAGFLEAMNSAGLAANAGVHRIDYSGDIRAQVQKLLPKLVKDGADSLVFVTNKLSICGLLVLREMGLKVPDDIRVVGFDGSETYAYDLYDTSVTYVKQPVEKFGLEAFDTLLKIIDRDDAAEPVRILLNPVIILGKSSR